VDAIAAQALTHKLYQRLVYRRPEIQKQEDYYRGKQPLMFASDEWAKFHADRYKGFSDNWCGPVANAASERVAVTGLSLPGATGFSPEERALLADWRRNEMDAQQSQGVLTSVIAKRSHIMTWSDPAEPGVPLVTWEHPAFCEIEYDDEHPRIRKAALRSWRNDDTEFATLYTAGNVWKWYRPVMQRSDTGEPKAEQDRQTALSNGGWMPREVAAEAWPEVNPLGVVPIVEVPNRPMLRGEPLSDIAGVMAMQDAINLLWAYLFNAADHASMAARVVTGTDIPKTPVLDANGQKIGERPVKLDDLAKGRLLWLTGDAKIDQWDAAKLDVFTAVVEIAIGHVSAQTRTPANYLMTTGGFSNISGDTLKALAVGLVNKVREFHLFAAPAIRETFRLMALVRGEAAVADQCRSATVNWHDPENHSESQQADAFQKDIASGLPMQWALAKRYGLAPDEVSDVMALVEQNSTDPTVEALTGKLLAGAGDGTA
jgi:hypothetical protein